MHDTARRQGLFGSYAIDQPARPVLRHSMVAAGTGGRCRKSPQAAHPRPHRQLMRAVWQPADGCKRIAQPQHGGMACVAPKLEAEPAGNGATATKRQHLGTVASLRYLAHAVVVQAGADETQAESAADDLGTRPRHGQEFSSRHPVACTGDKCSAVTAQRGWLGWRHGSPCEAVPRRIVHQADGEVAVKGSSTRLVCSATAAPARAAA